MSCLRFVRQTDCDWAKLEPWTQIVIGSFPSKQKSGFSPLCYSVTIVANELSSSKISTLAVRDRLNAAAPTQPRTVTNTDSGGDRRNVRGPRCITIQRSSAGFGFTLRHFIVYPPDSVSVSCFLFRRFPLFLALVAVDWLML
ncbi:Rho GTPase-activating-like protein [Daphnia magna]|uniref:Rho GTPase-activating-like protein n=1 Tax=Daphnia magna TaxID=35525 RepID=A0A164SD67_9CRUS|nr:Rho GTPase-activating-like protein [Daphnia magna]